MAVLPILDLRDPAQFEAGHAPDAVNIPLAELHLRMHELPEKGAALRLFHDRPQRLAEGIALVHSRGYAAVPALTPALTEQGASRSRLWQPSPLLVECLSMQALAPGRAADLACGSGREAVYLASQGWHVDAVDILPDALAKVRDLAQRSAAPVNTIQHDLRYGIPLPQAQYALVAIFRFMHRTLLAQACQLLAPGGVLVVEVFHRRDDRDAHRDRARRVADGELVSLVTQEMRILVQRDAIERNGRIFSQLIARR